MWGGLPCIYMRILWKEVFNPIHFKTLFVYPYRDIYIPRTVKEVEPYAAIKAEKLNRVNVADESQLENIGEHAFKMCIGLKRFVFDGTYALML